MAKRRCVENSSDAFWNRSASKEKGARSKWNDSRKNAIPLPIPLLEATAVVFGKTRITQKLGVFGNRKTSRIVLNNANRFGNDLHRILNSEQRGGNSETTSVERDEVVREQTSPTFDPFPHAALTINRDEETQRRCRNRNLSPDVIAAGQWTTENSSVEGGGGGGDTNAVDANDSDSDSPVNERVKLRLDEIFPDLRCRDTGELYVERTVRRIYRQMVVANPEISQQMVVANPEISQQMVVANPEISQQPETPFARKICSADLFASTALSSGDFAEGSSTSSTTPPLATKTMLNEFYYPRRKMF